MAPIPKVRRLTASLWATSRNANLGEGEDTTLQSTLFILLMKQIFISILAIYCTLLCGRYFHICYFIHFSQQLTQPLTGIRLERLKNSNRIEPALQASGSMAELPTPSVHCMALTAAGEKGLTT